MALFALSAQVNAQVTTLRQAKMTVQTNISTHSVASQSLPFKWDADFAGEEGHVVYELTLPFGVALAAYGSETLFALYIPRVGNQVQVRLNGQLIALQGRLDVAGFDASQTPLFVTVPASLMHDRELNRLVIQTSVQALRWGGLSEVYFGLERALVSQYGVAKAWQQTSYVVILVALVLMGLICALIWWRQRRYESAKLYLYFVYSALAGSIAAVDHLLAQHLMAWPMRGIVATVALAWHVIFMARFALEAVGRQERWAQLFMLATTVAVVLAYLLAHPFYVTVTYGLLCLPLAAVLMCTAKVAERAQSTKSRLFFAVSLIVAVTALRDLFFVQWPASGMSHFVLLPQALFLFVLVMGWILAKRYTRQHRLYHDLTINLETRVAERERQLAHSFDALQQQGQERAKLLERQRIMQDIHDGVGGHLVSLVNLVKRGNKAAKVPGAQQLQQLQEHAQLALDELRMAVDAMQPVDGDLTTVLATLRYRLEPRLKAAGIALVWLVQDLPAIEDLTPQKVLQLQKILLEAFTNVMLHAKATTVTVSAQPSTQGVMPSYIDISLTDNGIGFDTDNPHTAGQGLANMRFRAEAIGIRLFWAKGWPEGATLHLQIPT